MWKLLLIFGTSLASIEDCSNGLSVLKLSALSLVPETPIANEPVVMTVQFNNPGADITSGTATNAITYNFMPLSPTVEDLCTNTVCPLTNGFNDRSTNSTWPDVSGSITSKITWTRDDGTQLLCIKVAVKTGRKNLRGRTNSSGIKLFKDNGIGHCPVMNLPSKELVLYRQWNKTKRTNSSRSPEEL